MTVASTTAQTGPFFPNGVTTSFAFDFAAASADEVEVISVASGVELVVSEALYSVTLNADGTGSVVFSSAPTAGPELYIRSAPDFQQNLSITNSGPFLQRTIEQGFDRAAIRDLRLKRVLDNVDTRLADYEAIALNPSLQQLAANVGFVQGGTGTVARDVQSKLRDIADLADFGAVYDGVTDSTVAWLAAMASTSHKHINVSGPVSVSLGAEITTTKTVRCVGGGVLIVRDEVGLTLNKAVLKVSGDDCLLELKIDGNDFGPTGVWLAGDRNVAYIAGYSFRGSASTLGYESLILDTGFDNTYYPAAYDFDAGDAPSGNVPRIVTCQGNGGRAKIPLMTGKNVVAGLTAASFTGISIGYADLDTLSDNGLYLLIGCSNVVVDGGRLNGVPEPAAISAATDIHLSNLIITNSGSIGLSQAARIFLVNCHKRYGEGSPSSLISTRGSNEETTTVVLQNCSGGFAPQYGGIAQFLAGAVHDFRVIGGHYVLTWTDDTDLTTKVVTHAAGNSVIYKNVVVEINDERTTPLGSGTVIPWDLPTLSADSVYDGVEVINRTAGRVRLNRAAQSFLRVNSTGLFRGDLTPASIDYLPFPELRQECLGVATAAPTVGSYRRGQYLEHAQPSAAGFKGWVCVTEGEPGTWKTYGAVSA